MGPISQYNAVAPPPGPNLMPLLVKPALIQGFLVGDHRDMEPTFQGDMGQWVREGRVKYQEDIVEGLENAPEAFLGLFSGRNVGKLLVRVHPDPTRATQANQNRGAAATGNGI